MALIASLNAGSRFELFRNWWRIVLVGFIILSIALGISYQLYLLYGLYQNLIRLQKRKLHPNEYLDLKKSFSSASSNFCQFHTKKPSEKPKNFGVYLGGFESPPTIFEAQLLSRWNLLIIDPIAPGVLEAISSGLYAISPQLLARLDLRLIVNQSTLMQIVTLTEWVIKNISVLDKSSNYQMCFTGVCICNWMKSCSTSFLKEFIYFLSSLGFLVYLEVMGPEFLCEPELIELQEIKGLIIRNGTILLNGEERNAFQMEQLRSTIKGFISEACLRSFVVLLWETINDSAQPSNAVIKRCYQWSRFYNAVPWIGTRSALKTAGLSFTQKEPLGAFEWLKKIQVMEIHKKWSSNQSIHQHQNKSASIDQICAALLVPWDQMSFSASFSSIEEPSLPSGSQIKSQKLCPDDFHISRSHLDLDSLSNCSSNSVSSILLSETSFQDSLKRQILTVSVTGSRFDYLGCFPLGISVTCKDFAKVVQLQHRLRKMRLLDEIKQSKLQEIAVKFLQFSDYLDSQCKQTDLKWPALMKTLSQQLTNLSTGIQSSIQVFIGLNSGFLSHGDSRFWSVYEFDEGTLKIYLSANTIQNFEQVILHTYLSSHGCPRRECFEAEFIFAEWSNSLAEPHHLPRRMTEDIGLLTPSELLKFLQDLCLHRISCRTNLVSLIIASVKKQLLDYTDVLQLKKMDTSGYLSGNVSPEALINTRLKWYQQNGCHYPDLKEALEMFLRTDISITKILRNRKLKELEKLTKSLADTLYSGCIDARTDLIFFSVFSAIKKQAFDETYIEVTDRNTLFNNQNDQAAAFAELFSTGARCEAYFDITPNELGKLLSDRYRKHHHRSNHEPPLWKNAESKILSTYAAAKIDVHPISKRKHLSGTQKLTSLCVFVIPALLDTILFTTTGRGLYLSEFMTNTEKFSATLALMISFLISGAVGTWVTCGGTYYLTSMAFSAMNSFLVTRLIGGFAFTVVTGLIGLVIFCISEGLLAGIIFFLYLIALTSYLCLLAALANFQYPGSAFQSGRPMILMLVPFLLLSPIVSIWIPGHDIYVYLAVLYSFIILLILSIRYLGSLWITWLFRIEIIDDQSLKKWYIDRYQGGDQKGLVNITESGLLKIARDTIIRDIKVAKKRFWKKLDDPVIKALANSHEASIFLLEWYCAYSQTPLPIPFSSTWNIQIKVALKTLKQIQTGIKLHNAFILWRQAGDEVGCNILYFVIALLDKWNAILAGGKQLLGLSATAQKFKVPVGFALAYYLIGAVVLEFNAAKLHTKTTQCQNVLIGDLSSLPEALKCESLARRLLYWKMLGRYCLFHVWSLAVSFSLIWIYQSTEDSTIIFLAYVGAYTGLLWYQYTKIFIGSRSLNPLIIAIISGILLGQLLRYLFPDFIYCDVIALTVATWTAAILSLWFAQIKKRRFNLQNFKISSKHSRNNNSRETGVYHAFTNLEIDPFLSQDELHTIFQRILQEKCYRINPRTYPGLQVRSILLYSLGIYRNPREDFSKFALKAFPNAASMLELVVMYLERGDVVIDCVPITIMTDNLINLRALSCFKNDRLQIVFGCDMEKINKQQSVITKFPQLQVFLFTKLIEILSVAEVILHAVAENYINLSHDDSFLAESLLALRPLTHKSKDSNIPSWVSGYLRSPIQSSKKARIFASFCERQTLRCLSLGFDSDVQWQSLPRKIRELIIKRCLGQKFIFDLSKEDLSAFNQTDGISIETYVARCDLGAYMAISKQVYASSDVNKDINKQHFYQNNIKPVESATKMKDFSELSGLQALKYQFITIYRNIGFFLKLLAISFVADPELQRELDYVLQNSNHIIRAIMLFLLTNIWNYSKKLQNVLMPIFLLYQRKTIIKFWKNIGYTKLSLKNYKILLENSKGHSTAFILPKCKDGNFRVLMYSGNLDRAPNDNRNLQRVSTYNYKTMSLLQLEEFCQESKINTYQYEYSLKSSKKRKISKITNDRYPIRRICIAGRDKHEEINFNPQGLVESGSYLLYGKIIRFKCYYQKGSNYDGELLRADFILSHLQCTVSWSVPPKNHPERLEKWIPHPRVIRATFIVGADVYESHWIYNHKFDPTIRTTLNGQPIQTPKMIKWDYLGVLKKPINCSFHNDDLLITFKTLRSNVFLGLFGLHSRQNRISTSCARSRLWNAWKNLPEFDGVTVRWLDERLLRKEPILRTYWRLRDYGDLGGAEYYLNENADSIMAAVDLDNSISGWAPLAIKIADLYSFGQGGDASSRTRSKIFNFDSGKLEVLAIDSGTWPNEGGGVSACRRDMINNLHRVNWYMISESANDFGLPKHQNDIKEKFLPILKTLVKGARTSNFSKSDILQITRALVRLNEYFSKGRHWSAVWKSNIVKESWRNLWTCDLAKLTVSEDWFRTEIPTIEQLDISLELWFRYLFIFSIPLPEQVPAIFQASHHGVSASYGIVCKIKRNCILQIWDHAISWREANLYLSSDLCNMAPFTRNTLLGLMRLTSHLTLHHADIIVPCADFFNPGWEIEIGTCQGSIENRKKFKRKINPVVNGITDMAKFTSIQRIMAEKPTVTMLSHIWYAKDIKTSILAADIIVNQWGFSDYRLEIYGAIDKSPSYSMDCFELIASKSLSRFVVLCGESDPITVLRKTWVFMNSSISEGLPLALGEAALTGVPIVCTDVGASLRVLTDPETGELYSAIVAPNDAWNLARAQINILALLDQWAQYANDPKGFIAPVLSNNPTQTDVEAITLRMYEKAEERKALGMKSRHIVEKSFGGSRYLREHEQMLWICKARYDAKKGESSSTELFEPNLNERLLNRRYHIPIHSLQREI
ncbi:putative glycosyl group 1 family protein [Erysiphe neolycopersici]|uniref:Putative glycosyl group 1 family protein n=1 Tax=Erysiphe neolycopersici TaxID=212602 RepID=A0A420HY97_9PEZI|nr:putative glycosyl group 1 family protein [Erysiphe neolycopersici]